MWPKACPFLNPSSAVAKLSQSNSEQQGVCYVSSRVLPPSGGAPTTAAAAAGASSASGVELSFPCAPDSSTRRALSGPALNLWAAPAAATTGANTTAAAAAAAGAGGSCAVTTLSPAVSYKQRVPGSYYYGYELSAVPCRPLGAAAAAAALATGDALKAASGDDAGAADAGGRGGRMAAQYGLYVVPDLKSPAQGGAFGSFSAASQSCRLSVTTVGRVFLSSGSFPCRLVSDPEAKLGAGRCFGDPARKKAAAVTAPAPAAPAAAAAGGR